jgi:hypothetical protein
MDDSIFMIVYLLFALILKDLYDVFIRNHIVKFFHSYKSYVLSQDMKINKDVDKIAKDNDLKIGIVSLNER